MINVQADRCVQKTTSADRQWPVAQAKLNVPSGKPKLHHSLYNQYSLNGLITKSHTKGNRENGPVMECEINGLSQCHWKGSVGNYLHTESCVWRGTIL
ncbi:hypothetical protein NPIL_36241 [Nephila pilipes]|uniref:Uncharacterized protein n=1 Tax=Nephila pilipes TaxID=299642 RepID=A0A8X6R6Y8_NEPPI|nr:hypothetical protein NPIL_36241 [Nephila pilipes]